MKVGDIVRVEIGGDKKYIAKIVDTGKGNSWAIEIISSKESVGHSLGAKLIGAKREQGWFLNEEDMSLIPQEETDDKKFRTGMVVETVEDIPFSPMKKGARGIVARAKKEYGYNYLGVFFDIESIDKYAKKENTSLLNSLGFDCTPWGYSTGYWVDASSMRAVDEGDEEDEGELVQLEPLARDASVFVGEQLASGQRVVVDPARGVSRVVGPNGETLAEFKIGDTFQSVSSIQSVSSTPPWMDGNHIGTTVSDESSSVKKTEQSVILEDRKNIPATYTWAARDQDGKLFVYPDKPTLDYRKTQWYGEHGKKVEDTLFSFLTFSRGPLNIREVL